MSLTPAGLAIARFLAPLFSSRAAQAGIVQSIRFLEALQGIGTGVAFSRRELAAIFGARSAESLVVFDVGSHKGRFLSQALTKIGPSGVIHAFEPAIASYRELLKHFSNDQRIRLNRFAFSAVAGTGVLFYDEPGSPRASLTPRPVFGSGKHSEGVRLETLDSYCQANAVARIDLLKLDVEGHELEVLEGGNDMLTRECIRRILLDFSGCNVDTRVFFRDIYEFLTAKQMKLSRLTPGGALVPVEHYDECLERFETTNYLATL